MPLFPHYTNPPGTIVIHLSRRRPRPLFSFAAPFLGCTGSILLRCFSIHYFLGVTGGGANAGTINRGSLQSSSSLAISSHSMGDNLTGEEGGHFGHHRNNNDETEKTIIRVMDHTTDQIYYIRPAILPEQVVSSSLTNGSDLTRKGFLSFINALVIYSLPASYSLVTLFAWTYPSAPKALVHYEETLVKVICGSNSLLWFYSLVMIPFAAKFKDGEAIDHTGFDIFIALLYHLLVFLIVAYCTTLQVYLQIPFWAILPFGIPAVLATVVYIEYQRPTIVKWGKNTWGKLGDWCAILQALMV